MEQVTEKEIVERINKEFDMMNKSEVQIDWDRELTFALYLIVKFERILKKSYEEKARKRGEDFSEAQLTNKTEAFLKDMIK